MHYRRLLATAPIASTKDFAEFARVLYPTVREDELQALANAYAVAITEPPSPASALDFLTARLLNKEVRGRGGAGRGYL